MATTRRRAVVTGGGRGIGRAVALALASAGHHVTVLGRNATTLSETAALAGGDARVVDVTDAAALIAVLTALGPTDILVSNAGAAESAPFLKSDDALFQRMMAVNFDSVVTASRAVLPGMIDRGFGRIVSVASLAGVKGYPYVTAYTAAKHAVVGFTRALALEVARKGVTVNAVCPGYVDTDLMTANIDRVMAKTGRSHAEALAEFTRANPQDRLIAPEEVADTVRWLCGDAAGAINGQAIAVSGGEA